MFLLLMLLSLVNVLASWKRVEKEEKESKMTGLNEKILFAVHFGKEQV